MKSYDSNSFIGGRNLWGRGRNRSGRGLEEFLKIKHIQIMEADFL